jgi:hypothetical protein
LLYQTVGADSLEATDLAILRYEKVIKAIRNNNGN